MHVEPGAELLRVGRFSFSCTEQLRGVKMNKILLLGLFYFIQFTGTLGQSVTNYELTCYQSPNHRFECPGKSDFFSTPVLQCLHWEYLCKVYGCSEILEILKLILM